jgi:F0F1-type ATP synthase membrane subunit b/b'
MEARGRDGRDAARHTHHQVHRDAQEIRRETQEIKRLAKRQGEELKQAIKQVRKSGFKKP